jgi:hypothetical protein
MKERITYIIRDPSKGYDPSNLEVTKSTIAVASLDGAKEHKITFSLAELPQEVSTMSGMNTLQRYGLESELANTNYS